MHDSPREACGIFGVYAPGEDVARITFFGLFALQHRGQESAGIATADGVSLFLHKDMGLVSQVFREGDLHRLRGHMAIGHTRYSTTGSSRPQNAQPIRVEGANGVLALGHNGNVINAKQWRTRLEAEWGCRFTTSTDSEVIAHLLANAPGRDWGERAAFLMRTLEGAYSLVVLTPTTLLAIRDPLGVRPLCLGRFNGGWVVASETCALEHIGATFLREVEPGEVVQVNAPFPHTLYKAPAPKRALCVFEFIYFARPDSRMDGLLLYNARRRMGQELAREHPVDADLVIGVPDSSIPAAQGFAEASGIPYAEGLIKNRYVWRTFIQPDQRIRDLGVRLKFNPLREVLEGKRLVVVDDSIVRGTTTPHVVNLLRRAGAREVHMRITAPPICWPCPFGIDMATRAELIAAHKSVEEIRQAIGADSLGYLSLPGLYRALGLPRDRFCDACFSGAYPVDVQLEMDKLALERV
ncbi:MAG: amidophosphoribosyltransferase [Dehalococcoidia bacterium]|nr:amidophosphoribosyltransferase [Dehalococcoidia bacterium]MDW8120283.1 amidophosphoribosyltransferase [Chloroflexota bacterium]